MYLHTTDYSLLTNTKHKQQTPDQPYPRDAEIKLCHVEWVCMCVCQAKFICMCGVCVCDHNESHIAPYRVYPEVSPCVLFAPTVQPLNHTLVPNVSRRLY